MTFKHEPILKDKELNRKLFDDGFVTLPFLNPNEVKLLKELFIQHHTESEVIGNGLYVTAARKNTETVHSVSDGIKEIFARSISQHIENGQTLGGTFITKPANESEPLQPHQDWSIVDESRFRSFTIWVPLNDVEDENGSMYVLPKSHEFIRGYRHVTIPSVCGLIYDHTWKHLKPMHLKSGEALIFDHALIHASKPNCSDKIWIAATHSLLSVDAAMRFYWNNNGTVEEFEGEKYFYNTEEAKIGPGHLTKIKALDFEMIQLDRKEFNNLAGVEKEPIRPEPASIQKNGRWLKRLFG
ncbi:MAG: phytanoyl-CoA dioxygenase family protein [Flavobacteriales bacterium]|nr:phytanoyl-CoA dioxygenase family protein [Flavobacteriales bacterium]